MDFSTLGPLPAEYLAEAADRFLTWAVDSDRRRLKGRLKHEIRQLHVPDDPFERGKLFHHHLMLDRLRALDALERAQDPEDTDLLFPPDYRTGGAAQMDPARFRQGFDAANKELATWASEHLHHDKDEKRLRGGARGLT